MRAPGLLLLVVLSGCGPTRVALQHDPRFTSLESSNDADVVLSGRRFNVAVLDVPGSTTLPAPATRVMTVAGDGRAISFHVSNAPTAPTIAGATLQFGSHAFTVTAVPGEYEVDGRPERLDDTPRAVHVFSDGQYHGIQQRR